MSVRPTTVRRLAILFAVLVALFVLGAALYLHNEHKKAVRLADARTQGMAAFQSGDYHAALDNLKIYVARVKNDTDALYAYGVSRSRVEAPNNTAESIKVFNAILQLDPTNLPARHQLLSLYNQMLYGNEAIDVADRILADHPDDREALRGKVIALVKLRKPKEALAVSEHFNDIDPTDLDQQLITCELMRQTNRPPEDLITRAKQLQQKHPDDPRFEFLLGFAYGNAGDEQAGRQWLTTAATRPAPDAAFVRQMVRVFDSLREYRQSQELLDRAVAKENPDPLIMRVLVQRLWQNGRNDEVLDRLAKLDPASPKSDTGLLAYRALALFEKNRQKEASQIVAALAQRKSDSDAIAWATALQARFAKLDPKSALAQYQAALGRAPDNAVIRFLIGEAYARLGEDDLARTAWERAAKVAPSWAMPRLAIARVLADEGRLRDAAAAAADAYHAAPEQLATRAAYAAISFQAIEKGQADRAEEGRLLTFVADIQNRIPGEAETLPVYVNLLARAGRKDDAINAVRAAVADGRQYDQATILRLLSASRRYKLSLEDDLRDAARDEEDDPRVTLAQAADMAASGKPSDGLALLEQRKKSATTQPVQWQLALVQYKELIRDSTAPKDWIALGDANPNELSVQNAVLKGAMSVRGDRDFVARTIDRVRNLTGPDAQTWKLERARWLIGSNSPKDAAEAVNTLNEIVHTSPTLTEARLLLARAYESVGNIAAATKELTAAAEQDRRRYDIVLELARLLQQQNKFADARSYLQRLAASEEELPPETRRHVARMFASQGDFAPAAKALEALRDPDSITQRLLAEIYRRAGRHDDAQKIYTKLLAAKPLEIETITTAADFYASRQQLTDAERALSRLPEANPKAGTTELVLAQFNERWGSADVARRQYVSATAAASSDPMTWRELIAFHLRVGRFEQAKQAADDAVRVLPDDPSLKRLRDASAKLMRLGSANAALRPALTILAASIDDHGVEEFLSTFDESAASTQPASADAMAARLKDAATQHPRSLPLQMALVQLRVATGNLSDAAATAERAMETFPSDTDAARIATEVYRAARQWDRAAAAARKWIDRSAQNPQPASIVLSEIELSRGDAPAAAKALEPYVRQVKSNPQKNPDLTAALVRAYATGGREYEAKDILQPLLPKDRAWRVLWMQIASTNLRDTASGVAWLNQVEPMIADNVERVELGRAWYALGVRGAGPSAFRAAGDILDPVVARPDAPADLILLRGAIADGMGDAKIAESHYRRGLKLSPNHPEAMNNLAYLILRRDGDLQEAKTLAADAVKLAPGSASFLDTLGRIQARSKDRDGALASFKKALALEPNSLEALIGMASTLLDAGKRDSAADVLMQIDKVLKTAPSAAASMSTDLRKELDTLRATMKAAA